MISIVTLNTNECNNLKIFSETYSFRNIFQEPTCFKNPQHLTCIDLIVTNRKECFQNTTTIETGISDYHKMKITCLKTYIKKYPPKIIFYRNYNHFNGQQFCNDIKWEIENKNIDHVQYDTIKQILISQLDKYAPLKKKHIWANNAPYMDKNICKAIMARSRMKNTYIKCPSKENERLYKNQRNFCVNLPRKSKKKYYNKLVITKLKDTKSFWKHTKPLFSEKHKKI